MVNQEIEVQVIIPLKLQGEGKPRINLQQGKGGKAKPYQVKQVKQALLKLKESQKDESSE